MPVPGSDPIIVAPTPNPFRPDESIDHDRLARNVERWLKTKLSGFVVNSYGGEEFHIGEPEKVAAIKTVAKAHRGQRFVIAGIDTLSPTEAVRLADLYAQAGADMVRVRIPPPARRDGPAEPVQKYFETVTKESPVPVVVIHQPKVAMSVDASPEEIRDICALDNVFAYIISLNFRWEARIAAVLPKKTKLWTCNGSLLLPGGMLGATGACLFFGNWGPGIAYEIISLCMAGDYAKARALQERITHADFLGMSWGNAALKGGLNLLGYEAGLPRRPQLPLSSDQVNELKAAFVEAGLLPK
ncbi:MAG: dihydrodipicolinate synthase family protein [SAR202 cluster bacterium]|nr:dihydrodipicolinate synthase family protein [SAR202 cluster bacterium]